MKTRNLVVLGTALAALTFALGAGEPGGATSLFNGKDLAGWKTVGSPTNTWSYGHAALDAANRARLVNSGPGTDLVSTNKNANLSSEATFGDCRVEMEFMLAKGSNSGIKLMNIYEIQLFDSYGKTVLDRQDCGAIYSENAPKVNACKPPGEWQTIVIEFRAPKFDAAGKKTADARFVKVTLNGQVVQEDMPIAHGTNVSRNAPEKPLGPVYLQGDHGPVAFRNLKITPL